MFGSRPCPLSVQVFLCCARVLCVPDLTVALLGIVLAREAAGANWLVCAKAGRGARASMATSPIQAIRLSMALLQIGSFDRENVVAEMACACCAELRMNGKRQRRLRAESCGLRTRGAMYDRRDMRE